jgi:hypothetical protein
VAGGLVGRGLEVLGLGVVEVLCVQGSHDLDKLEGAGHVMVHGRVSV